MKTFLTFFSMKMSNFLQDAIDRVMTEAEFLGVEAAEGAGVDATARKLPPDAVPVLVGVPLEKALPGFVAQIIGYHLRHLDRRAILRAGREVGVRRHARKQDVAADDLVIGAVDIVFQHIGECVLAVAAKEQIDLGKFAGIVGIAVEHRQAAEQYPRPRQARVNDRDGSLDQRFVPRVDAETQYVRRSRDHRLGESHRIGGAVEALKFELQPVPQARTRIGRGGEKHRCGRIWLRPLARIVNGGQRDLYLGHFLSTFRVIQSECGNPRYWNAGCLGLLKIIS